MMILEKKIRFDLVVKVLEENPELKKSQDINDIQNKLRELRATKMLSGDENYYVNGLILDKDKVQHILEKIKNR